MKKTFFVGLSVLGLALSACSFVTNVPPKRSQLEIRQFQTRNYETSNRKLVMKAVLDVLQDEGYAIKNVNFELGLITASKETDLGGGPSSSYGSPTGFFRVRGRYPQTEPRWDKLSVMECSVNVSDFGKQTRVRLTFQSKVLDNVGAVTSVRAVEDERFYQDFFSKIDKGIFIQKEKI